MEAQMTLKVSPAEFDLLRRALNTHRVECYGRGNDEGLHPQERRDAKAEALLTTDLISKLSP